MPGGPDVAEAVIAPVACPGAREKSFNAYCQVKLNVFHLISDGKAGYA